MTRNNLLKERIDILAGDLKRRDDEELFDLIDETAKRKNKQQCSNFDLFVKKKLYSQIELVKLVKKN